MKLLGFILGFVSILILILIIAPLFSEFSPDTEWLKIFGTVAFTMIVMYKGFELLLAILKFLISKW